MSSPIAEWPRVVIEGLSLAGVLVGLWEWEDLVLRPRGTTGSRVVLTLGVPLMLVLINRWGPTIVPFGVLVVALLAMWYLVPRSAWNLVGSAAVVLILAVQAASTGGGGRQTGIELGMVLALILVLHVAARRAAWFRTRIFWYVGVTGATAIYMFLSRVPVPQLVISVVVAGVAGAYMVGRADREHRWEHDIYRAEHDALTGALTRHGLDAWIRRLTPQARSLGLIVACDLDDFKWLNDTWGHALGDQVLQAVAKRLRAELRDVDAVVRPGGDEFTVWMPGVPAEAAEALVQRLHRAVTQGYDLAPGSVHLGVSMGWACGALTEETARVADQHLLRAKRQGKNRVAKASATDSIPADKGWVHLGWLGDAARALWALWPTAAVLTNRDGRIVAVNPAYEQLTGRTWADLANQSPGINSAGETPPEVYRALWHALQQGKTWQGVLKNRRPDGTIWWGQEFIVPVWLGGQVVGYWGSVQEYRPDNKNDPTASDAPPASVSAWRFFQDMTLDVAFQPLVDLRTETVFGYEALIRPRRQGQPIAPGTVFAEAVQAGVVDQLDGACLRAVRRALRRAEPWPSGCHLFINVRCTTLTRPARFRRHLEELNAWVPSGQLVIEVSERGTTAVSDWEALARRYPHVLFAQDDVGVGEADLARLVRLRPAWIKLDIALVTRVADDEAARTLVGALTQWAHGLGTRVVAEGVETEIQRDILRTLGVDGGQGFLWAPPAPNFARDLLRCSPPS